MASKKGYRAAKLTVFPAVALLASGCASSHYMGISLIPGDAPVELQNLAMRARTGDKQAQLDLGIAFEEGRGGAAIHLDRARRLYEQAARNRDKAELTYAPSSGSGGFSTVPVTTGRPGAGLPQARERLEGLINQRRSFRRNAFGPEDLAALSVRFKLGQQTTLAIYPGALERPCWTSLTAPSLNSLLQEEMGSSVAAVMPLSCLFKAYQPNDLL